MNTYVEAKQGDFGKAIDYFKKDISSLGTGRINPSMLENIFDEAYGLKNPINGVANISVTDGRSMIITPWDKNIIKEVEKAIADANLDVGVVNEGDKIRINIPQMTEENRKELVKKLNEKHEAARISIRQTREEIKDQIEKAEKEKEISEDEKFKFIKELDEEVKERNEELKEITDKKEGEIMTV